MREYMVSLKGQTVFVQCEVTGNAYRKPIEAVLQARGITGTIRSITRIK